MLSFLLGASWAIAFFGALILFKSFLPFGIGLSIFVTIFFIFFMLFLILGLDAFSVNKQKLAQAKKQTKLLEQLYAKHTK
ncbi:hypothetical protein COB57_06165 [Candidatus Peregrinibacteria bacterium]|nr:MAG: hypothetical protein COB57_06165 [Candidatus Peregrinibacteria bacterium]